MFQQKQDVNGKLTLNSESLESHHQELNSIVDSRRCDSVDVILTRLSERLSEENIEILRNDLSLEQPHISEEDIRVADAYIEFLELNSISTEDISFELRVEEWFSYLLTDLSYSLIGNTQGQLVWTHDKEWFDERFTENTSGQYLCGQFMGKSKFASLADLSDITYKEQAIEALGMQGYDFAEAEGSLFLIFVNLEESSVDCDPKVPLAYNVKQEDGSWSGVSNFMDNSVPGYTSKGIAEAVFNTFEVKADDLNDLDSKGVEVRELPES